MASKLTYIGGGGVRTPLVIFGVGEAAKAVDAEELVLYDPDAARMKVMAAVGRAAVQMAGGRLRVRETGSFADATDGARFVMHSIRVGGIAGRAQDEAACVRHGFCGQETTGVGGAAMAFRTVPVAVKQAHEVAERCPNAWFISFTNPAGLITQAISDQTSAKVIGICDTPNHMFHRIADGLGVAYERVQCDYVGLNHLGWITKIRLDGEDVTGSILENDSLLAQFYSVPMFYPAKIRALRLIPTEYLYFYYERSKALAMQRQSETTRGAEIQKLNEALLSD
ncbi:MAG: 6-phospho-beta-glucosidase, partial [Ktedonobacteraceae bacterium]